MKIDEVRLLSNIDKIRSSIADTCDKCGRSTDDITLIAVTKTVTAEYLSYLYQAGIYDIGENRVQVASEKFNSEFNQDLFKWHLIGHLQSNKVKQAIEIFNTIHSVDSEHLAQKISEKLLQTEKIYDILMQVNVSGEDTKFGINLKDIDYIFEKCLKFDNLRIRGLMTMAPFTKDSDVIRKCFAGLRLLQDKLRDKFNLSNFDILSMGMSNDFISAIREGATHLRIGSAIFNGTIKVK